MSFHPLDPLLDAVGFDNKASFENKTVVPFVDSYYTDIDHSDDDSQPGPGHAVPIFPTHMISWGANSRDGDGDIPTQVPLQAKPALILLSQQQQRTHNPWGQLLQAAKAGSKGAHHPHRPGAGPQRRSAVAAAKAEAAASRAAALVAIATTAAASASVAVDEDDDDDAKEARDTSQPDYEVGDTTVDGDGVAWRVCSVDGATGDKVTWEAIKDTVTTPTSTPRRRRAKQEPEPKPEPTPEPCMPAPVAIKREASDDFDDCIPDYQVGDTTVDVDGVAWRVRSVDGVAGDKVTWQEFKARPRRAVTIKKEPGSLCGGPGSNARAAIIPDEVAWPVLRNLPRTFTLGVRTVETARFLDVIRAVGSVTRPSVDPQAQLRLSMGIVNLQRMVTAKIGREVVPGALNAIVKNIYGRHSKQGNICKICGGGATRAICGKHYGRSVKLGRGRVTILHGITPTLHR